MLLLPLLLAVLPGAAESATDEDDVLCARCKTTGCVPNPYAASRGEHEREVLFCSTYIEGDRDAAGFAELPCDRCRRPDLALLAEKRLEEHRQRARAWLAERRRVDEELGVPLVHVRTEHFQLAWQPERFKSHDKRMLDGHEAAHLYAARLEGMYADFQQLFGFTDENVRNTLHQVYVLDKLDVMIAASEKYLKMWSDTAAKLAGDPSILVTWFDRGNLSGDLGLDRHIAHHVAHLLYSVFHLKEWLFDTGFLDEGMAHYFEMRYFLTADNSCNQEEHEEHFGNQVWPQDILGDVRRGRALSWVDMAGQATDELGGAAEHSMAWSMFDYLMSLGPEKVRDLMVLMKGKTELREALKQVYGMTVFQLEEGWKAYVLESYPERIEAVKDRRAVLPAIALRAWPPPVPDED